jgi:invasion protein IalB
VSRRAARNGFATGDRTSPSRQRLNGCPAASAHAPSLPGGASTLQETFGDWVVSCAIVSAAKRCSVIQQQADPRTRQRVVGIELSTAGDKVEGVLLLPLGLALDRGAALQIDDLAAEPPLKFRTCVPGGCMVAINFEAKRLAALRAGSALKAMVAADDGKAQIYTVSLKGFAAALDRLAALMKA